VVVTRRSASPYLPLADFERAIDGKFRRKLLARRRQVPDLSFERVTSADQGALEEVFRLEGAGWKGEAGTAILSSPATRGFYTELARRSAAAGALSLSLLRSGDKVIAAHFALEDHTAYYLLKPGYDPDFARFGPGHLLVYEAARDARDRGLSEFDFLGQEMAWKLAWTARRRRHLRIQIYRSGARGRAAHALFHVIRPALGRVRRAVRGAGRRPRVSDAVRPPAGAGVRTEPIESPGPTNPPGVISGG
jgi:CelD/BcsL family acetyltransferase involved in cellulose biosynthesis